MADLVKMTREIAAMEGRDFEWVTPRASMEEWERLRLIEATEKLKAEQESRASKSSAFTEEVLGEAIMPLYRTTTVRIPHKDVSWRADKSLFAFVCDKLAEGGIRMVYPCDKFEDFCVWWDDNYTEERVYRQTILVLPNGDEYVQARSQTPRKANPVSARERIRF